MYEGICNSENWILVEFVRIGEEQWPSIVSECCICVSSELIFGGVDFASLGFGVTYRCKVIVISKCTSRG